MFNDVVLQYELSQASLDILNHYLLKPIATLPVGLKPHEHPLCRTLNNMAYQWLCDQIMKSPTKLDVIVDLGS